MAQEPTTPGSYPLLHVVVLASFAFAQPVFAVLSADPTFFVSRRSTPGVLIAFAVVLVLGPGLLASGVIAVARRLRPRIATSLHLVLVGTLVGAIALPWLNRIDGAELGFTLTAAAALGRLAVVLYRRSEPTRRFLSMGLIAPVVFLGTFLLASPVTPLVVGSATPPDVPSDVTARNRTPVVLLVFDEFPVVSMLDAAGRIDATRVPNLARLAELGTWYPNATTVSPLTFEAVPAILSGRRPQPGDLPVAWKYPDNVFRLFASQHLNVHEPFTDLCTAPVCASAAEAIGLVGQVQGLLEVSTQITHRRMTPQLYDGVRGAEDPFGEFINAPGRAVTARRAQRVNAEIANDQGAIFAHFLESVTDQPGLNFAHLFLPHGPFGHFPSGLAYEDATYLPGAVEGDRWSAEPAWSRIAQARHLLQIGYADRLVGDLLDRLGTQDMLDESLIVVVADHGVSFTPDTPRRGVGSGNAYDIAAVPLLVKYPRGGPQGVVETAVSTLDILPTILDVLDLDVPWEPDGRSLLDPTPRTLRIRDGQRVTDLEDVAGGVARALGRLVWRFLGDDGIDPYRPGVAPHLLGQQAPRSEPAPPGTTTRVDRVGRFLEVDLASGVVPALVRARIDDPTGRITAVALALNGRISTVVPVLASEDDWNVVGLLRAEDFVDGANSLRLLGLGRDGAFYELETGLPRAYALTDDGLIPPDGPPIPFAGGSIRGDVEAVTSYGTDTVLAGWAVDITSLTAATNVIVLADGVAIGDAAPDGERPTIAELYGDPAVAVSGWTVTVRSTSLESARSIEVVAVGPDGWGPLTVLPGPSAALPRVPWTLRGDTVIAPDGTRFDPTDALTGAAKITSRDGSSLLIEGYAGSVTDASPAAHLLVAQDGRVLRVVRPNVASASVGDLLGASGTVHAGFAFRVDAADGPPLAVYALGPRGATLLATLATGTSS